MKVMFKHKAAAREAGLEDARLPTDTRPLVSDRGWPSVLPGFMFLSWDRALRLSCLVPVPAALPMPHPTPHSRNKNPSLVLLHPFSPCHPPPPIKLLVLKKLLPRSS